MNIDNCNKYAMHNKKAIHESEKCGCYFCENIFLSSQVYSYVDDDQTALCPTCGIDALLPGVTDKEFLHKAHQHWFTPRHRNTD